MAKRIKVMAEYGYFPLWDMDDVGDIDPADLPLSQETIELLTKWQATYDTILNLDDPASSGFASPEAKTAFEQEGRPLAQQIQQELGDEYEVFYRLERVTSPV